MEEKGARSQYKLVIGEDRSVQVFDMQGNLIADKAETEGPGNPALTNNTGPKKPQLHSKNLKQSGTSGLEKDDQQVTAKAQNNHFTPLARLEKIF